MSYSLALHNGDLSLNGRSYATVTGPAKVYQDLRCALLTPLGFYENNLGWGSQLETFIGESNWNRVATLVGGEIRRIVADYQAKQVTRNQSDGERFGRYTLSPSEIVLGVKEIEFTRTVDVLLVTVEIELGAESIISINIPLEV